MLCCVRKNSLLPVDGIGIVDHFCGFGFKALKVLTALCSNAREGWGSVMGNCSLTRGRMLIGLAVSSICVELFASMSRFVDKLGQPKGGCEMKFKTSHVRHVSIKIADGFFRLGS